MNTITDEAMRLALTISPTDRAVIGIMYNHQVWLYDAADFREPGVNEVYMSNGDHWVRETFTWEGRTYNSTKMVLPFQMDSAHRNNRYWPGDDIMAQQALDETLDAFLAGGR